MKIEQVLNQSLTAEYGAGLFLAFDNPVPEDLEAKRADMQARRTNGVSTANEERVRIGEEEFDEPEADMLHVSSSLRAMSEERRQEGFARTEAAQAQGNNLPPGSPGGRRQAQQAQGPDRMRGQANGRVAKAQVPGRMASRTLRNLVTEPKSAGTMVDPGTPTCAIQRA